MYGKLPRFMEFISYSLGLIIFTNHLGTSYFLLSTSDESRGGEEREKNPAHSLGLLSWRQKYEKKMKGGMSWYWLCYNRKRSKLIWYLTLIGFLNKAGCILRSCQKSNFGVGVLAQLKYFTFFLDNGNQYIMPVGNSCLLDHW